MTTAEYAAEHGLSKVGGRAPFREYLLEVWQRRGFIYSMARYKIEAENQQNSLGMLWVILKPLLNALVYGLVFGILVGTQGRPPQFVVFLVIGIFIFEYFSSSWTAGGKAITSNASLVQSLAFPRMVLPLSAVVQRLLLFIPMVGILLVILMVSGTPPQVHWLLIIPLVVIYTFFNAGLALVTARLSSQWRDLNNFLPFLTRFVFYTTGIFFSIEKRFKDHPLVIKISDFQPIHEFLSLTRSILLQGSYYTIDERFWFRASAWSFGLFVFGLWFFWRAEEKYGRVD